MVSYLISRWLPASRGREELSVVSLISLIRRDTASPPRTGYETVCDVRKFGTGGKVAGIPDQGRPIPRTLTGTAAQDLQLN